MLNNCWSTTIATALLAMMTSLSHAHAPLSTDYHVTSYGSALQLDCLALRTVSTTPRVLDLTSAVQSVAAESSSDQRTSRAGSSADGDLGPPEVDPEMNFVQWILPDLRTIEDNSSVVKDVSLISGKNGSIALLISFVRPEHLGDYICHAYNTSSNQRIYSRSRIFFVAPPVWQEYRTNFITALAASGSTLVLTTLLCIVHSLRWKPKDGGDDEEGTSPTSCLVVGNDVDRHERLGSGRDEKYNEGFTAEGSTCM